MPKKQDYTPEQWAQRQETCRKWQAANKERVKARKREWRKANPVSCLYLAMKGNAKQRGRELEITLPELEGLLAPMTCALTGLPLTFDGGPWAPSVDRKDCNAGYTRDNVRVVAWGVNCALNTHGDKFLLKMARALVAKHGMEDQ